ncbi:hypothetical protein BUALT_Bualt13G0012400 [Buddleja alternifolia]|uniref:Gnk2-homologous domain-containing protein n=1 Tax=Buddleja alternifolia TaxID=168488 RepID=A0AAV6WUU1_9LAMI|nr:hypothetical protein BUALT_Bualt13G0012400 [Buddleja alternifolia]
MSQVSSFHATMITITLVIGLLATTFFPVAKSDPNTNVDTIACNINTYAENDPFGDSVAYVLADLMNVAPSQQGYNYYTVSPYPTSVAYGHATCSQSLANSECANCLATARGTVSSSCASRVGGQVALVDCGMRFYQIKFELEFQLSCNDYNDHIGDGITGDDISSVAESDPNTNVDSLTCNAHTYAENDPFENSVAYVLADLMNVTPSQKNYNYYTAAPYRGSAAYGHATCSIFLANSDF